MNELTVGKLKEILDNFDNNNIIVIADPDTPHHVQTVTSVEKIVCAEEEAVGLKSDINYIMLEVEEKETIWISPDIAEEE